MNGRIPAAPPGEPGPRQQRRLAQQAGKKAAQEIGRRTGRQVRRHAAQQMGKKAAAQAGKRLVSEAGKKAVTSAATKAGTQAAISGSAAVATGGVSAGVEAGIRVGVAVVKRVGWKRAIVITMLLLTGPGLLFGAAVSFIAMVAALPDPTLGGGAPAAVPGIPPAALDAYIRATQTVPQYVPGATGLSWSVLAAIGKIESDHAAGHTILANGDVTPRIIGPRLDGSGAGGNTRPVPAMPGTSAYDGDPQFQHAVGPMQFLPETWMSEGKDGNGDGRADPENFYDAALTTAIDLYSQNHNLADRAALRNAIYHYNHSWTYVDQVLQQADRYAQAVPTAPGQTGPGQTGPGQGTCHAAAASAAAQIAINFACSQLGQPYLWGGTGPLYDCSGLVQAAWRRAGVSLPRTTYDQWNAGTHVSYNQLQPGDLVFFEASLGHVGMYLGGGMMIHDPHTGDVVKISDISSGWYRSEFQGGVHVG